MKEPLEKKKYKVWVSQVNRVKFTVEATDENSARHKAMKKWRDEYAHSYIEDIEELDS